jgi:hypothetical protein
VYSIFTPSHRGGSGSPLARFIVLFGLLLGLNDGKPGGMYPWLYRTSVPFHRSGTSTRNCAPSMSPE